MSMDLELTPQGSRRTPGGVIFQSPATVGMVDAEHGSWSLIDLLGKFSCLRDIAELVETLREVAGGGHG